MIANGRGNQPRGREVAACKIAEAEVIGGSGLDSLGRMAHPPGVTNNAVNER